MTGGIGPGDAVFVPSLTFVATAEVVAVLGATPVFVDIDENTLNMDPAHLEQQVERTVRESELQPRAVIPVDLFGRPADYPSLNDCAERNRLLVVADAAQSLGARSGDARVGALAPISATSFYPSKTLGGYGDGGCVFTDDDRVAEVIRSIQRHGYEAGGPEIVTIGINSRLDTMQAAILLAKLEVFQDELGARRRVAEAYDQALKDYVDVPAPYLKGEAAWSVYCIQSDKRDMLRQTLGAQGIASVAYYATPIHLQPAYLAYGGGKGSLPVTERAAERLLALPMHAYLDEASQQRVCSAIIGALSD
jgi:dTDP-4-amino-4,6-dideoxygalactose transaminase